MVPVFRVIILLVLAHAIHVHCDDFIVRPIVENYGYRPDDYKLDFVNNWESEAFDSMNAEIQLRCYAILYRTKNPITIMIRRMNLAIGAREQLRFYVRPGAFKYGWRIQCDSRSIAASQKALMGGVVLVGGNNSQKCRDTKGEGGCVIQFIMGEVRRSSPAGTEFLGEMFENKCDSFGLFCKERNHPRFMFGQFCPDRCNF